MKVLLTGGSGLIGRHTALQLLSRGHWVRTFQRGPAVGPVDDHVSANVVTDYATLRDAARGCEVVVHLAGRGDVAESRRDPAGSVALNAGGALAAIEAARGAGAALVLASTQRVYPLQPGPCRENDPPRPDSPYGSAKLAAEWWCRLESEQFGVPTTVLRFFSVYGPGQQPNGQSGVVAIFARAALDGNPLLVQSHGRRDLTDVRDVARALAVAAERPVPGHRLMNVATGVGSSFRALAQLVVEVFASRSPIVDQMADAPGCDLVADPRCARELLGFTTTIPLRDGLAHYRDWLLAQDDAAG